jgi:hypothetical protein
MRSDLGPFLFGVLVGGLLLVWLVRRGGTELDRLAAVAGGAGAAGGNGTAAANGDRRTNGRADGLAGSPAVAVACGCSGARRGNAGSWWAPPASTQIPNRVPTN